VRHAITATAPSGTIAASSAVTKNTSTGITKALSDLGTVAAAVDDLELAAELFAESARRFRELDEPSRLAIVLANVGHISHQQGDYAHSIEVTEEAVAIQQRLGHKHSEAISLYNLGSSYLSAGELDRARRRLVVSASP